MLVYHRATERTEAGKYISASVFSVALWQCSAAIFGCSVGVLCNVTRLNALFFGAVLGGG